jgi:hypothetical protein
MAQGGRRSGNPDCVTFRRPCPDAPGHFNLKPGIWTGTQTAPAIIVYQWLIKMQ